MTAEQDPARQLGMCDECGCCWFRLRHPDGTEGGFSIDANGRIGGRSGDLCCRDCGKEYVPLRERLTTP